MTLGELILTLKPLLAAPRENAQRILALLESHKSLAEFEVARVYAGRAFAPFVEDELKSADPRRRAQSTRGLAFMLGRADAARLLRRMVKDHDPVVRSAARAAVKRLALHDVALPDSNFAASRSRRPFALGGWNPTGWSYGLFRRKERAPIRAKFPPLADAVAVAKWLGVTQADLSMMMRPGEGEGSPYVAFAIPKRSGGTRTIHAPRAKLKQAQRKILDEILARVSTHAACHGFVKKRSIVTNAAPHVGSHLVIRVDLSDFFPSIHYRRVVGLFRRCGYSPLVAGVLASLTTHRASLADGPAWPGVVPQGAPTSPAIANAVCKRLDARLTALAAKAGARYTRYADDLSFSFPSEPKVRLGRFLWWVDQICQQEGFHENPGKRRIHRRANQQRVTGLVVNDKVTIPRERRRRFRALLHRCKTEGLAAMVAKDASLRAELDGFVAFVHMVQPALAAKLKAEIEALG